MRRPPPVIRLLHTLTRGPAWLTMPEEALDAYRAAENRRRSSRLIRVFTGFPDRGATIIWQEIALPDRVLRVRVHRPSYGSGLPLVVHVHGGGFVGTAPQSDWINSHLAARLPAVVVSVEHRLLAAGVPMSAAADDCWDVLRHVIGEPEPWGIDPRRVAVFGESAGALITALAAIRARDAGLPLRAQVLVNPCVDVTAAAYDHPSMKEHADSPMISMTLLELFRRLAAPEGTDARAVSPLHAADHSGLAPALVVVPTVDPLADQGRAYGERLRAAGTPVRVSEHPGAIHAFLSMPGMVPQARDARDVITGFLRERLR